MSLPQTSPPLILQMFPLKSRNHITYTQLGRLEMSKLRLSRLCEGRGQAPPSNCLKLIGKKIRDKSAFTIREHGEDYSRAQLGHQNIYLPWVFSQWTIYFGHTQCKMYDVKCKMYNVSPNIFYRQLGHTGSSLSLSLSLSHYLLPLLAVIQVSKCYN